MSRTKTLHEQALEKLGVNTPTWILEAAESLAESYASPLRERAAYLTEIINSINGCRKLSIKWPEELENRVNKLWEEL